MITSILSAISAIWGIIKLGIALFGKLMDWLAEKAVKQKDKDLREELDKAEKAKTIEEKADAACAIEKQINPDSDCDKP